jgi:autophagy-related protein 16
MRAKKTNSVSSFLGRLGFVPTQSSEISPKETSPIIVIEECTIPSYQIRKIQLHESDINGLAISRDAHTLATASNDKKIILTDLTSYTPKITLSGCLQSVMSVSFSPTSEYILGTSNDQSVRIWHISGRSRLSLTGHVGKVYAAKFSTDDRVVSGSHDRTIKIWDLNKGYCIKTLFTLSSCNDLCVLDGDAYIILSLTNNS